MTPKINIRLEENIIDLINLRSFSYNAGRTKFQICRAMYGKQIKISNTSASLICRINTSAGEKKFSVTCCPESNIFTRKSRQAGVNRNDGKSIMPNANRHRISVVRKASKCVISSSSESVAICVALFVVFFVVIFLFNTFFYGFFEAGCFIFKRFFGFFVFVGSFA